jgi:hypothetical protein
VIGIIVGTSRILHPIILENSSFPVSAKSCIYS